MIDRAKGLKWPSYVRLSSGLNESILFSPPIADFRHGYPLGA